MKRPKTDDEVTRDILNTIRRINESSENTNGKRLLNEAEENNKSNAIAKFSKPEEEDVASSPLIYLPDDGNLVFSGVIPCLNNLKWQFVLKTSTGNGCFTWCDGLILTKENMAILNKLYGYYVNWKESWTMEASDLEALANHFKENR